MAKKKPKRKASVLKAYDKLIRSARERKRKRTLRNAEQAKQEYIDRTTPTFASTIVGGSAPSKKPPGMTQKEWESFHK